MLINIKVENFLSFDEETQLTMIPSSKIRKMPNHKVKIKKISLLKYAIIYGANAAGKSNLIRIFEFMANSVGEHIPVEANSMFCKSKESNSEKPSKFELQFSYKNKFYAYGFEILLKNKKIKSEWLVELYSDGNAELLFQRDENQKPHINDELVLEDTDINKLNTYIEDFDENSNTLFLSFMNNEKKYNETSKLIFFKDVYNYITKNLKIGKPDTSLTDFSQYTNETSLKQITDLVKMFDTGISEIRIEETSLDELKQEVPSIILDKMLSNNEKYSDNKSYSSMVIRSQYSFFDIEILENGELKVSTIKLKHNNTFYDFNYKDESDGTRRLIELLDMLLTKEENIVYIIDEIERSMHQRLIIKFLEIFDEIHINRRIQLFFTTHETSLLNLNMFRRDEIWFVDRDFDSKSSVYPLNKFTEIYDTKLTQAYLDGRYGAIPIFKSFNFKGE